MITILSHDKWKVYLAYSWSLTWVIRGEPSFVDYVDFFVDVSADPGSEEFIDSDYFYPDTASSFNASVLTDGYISHRTHTFHDLIHLKFSGTIFGLEQELFTRNRVPSSYTNLRGRGNIPGAYMLGGSKPIWITDTVYYESWGNREYDTLWCVLYWPFFDCKVLVSFQTPNTYREGYIVDPWATKPTYVPYKNSTARVTVFQRLLDGTYRKKLFEISVPCHYTWTGEYYQRYLSAMCSSHIVEWRRALASLRGEDPLRWDSYFNPCRSYVGRGLTYSKPDFNQARDHLFPDRNDHVNWHQLAAEAYQDLGMADINGVANIKELLEMGSAVTSFTKTLKSIPVKRVKAAASAWLAVHYGFKLTILDAQELYSKLNDFTYRRSSLSKAQATTTARIRDLTYEYRYQVFFDVFAQLRDELLQCMAISDAFLTLENAWDMVPWSFVIDWFVDVGSVLQSLDNWFNLRQRHDVVAVGRSIKSSRTVSSSVLVPWSNANLDVTYYAREYTKELVSPSIIPSVTLNPFNHLVEAAALFISIK